MKNLKVKASSRKFDFRRTRLFPPVVTVSDFVLIVSNYATRYNLSSINQPILFLIALVRSVVPGMPSKLLRNGTPYLSASMAGLGLHATNYLRREPPTNSLASCRSAAATVVFHLVLLRPAFCSWRRLLSVHEKWFPPDACFRFLPILPRGLFSSALVIAFSWISSSPRYSFSFSFMYNCWAAFAFELLLYYISPRFSY